MINKTNIPRPLGITPHKLLIPLRPLVLRVPRQHALDTHADALDVLHRAPPRRAEQVEADDAVGVDVRVDRDGADERRWQRWWLLLELWGGGLGRRGCGEGRGGCGGRGGEGEGGGREAEEDDFGGFCVCARGVGVSWFCCCCLGGWGGFEGGGKGTDWVVVVEAEAEAVDLVEIQGVVVQDLDIHLPFFEVVGGDEGYAWWE